jgi:hypothetical protein
MKTLMSPSKGRLAAGAGALALAGLCAAGAYAVTSSGARAGAGGLGRGALVSAVTSELGITPAQLRSDLAAGQTLSQIASANGATSAELEQTILGVVQSARRAVQLRPSRPLPAGDHQTHQKDGVPRPRRLAASV